MKLSRFLLLVFLLCGTLVLSSCMKSTLFEEEWTVDETYHWHQVKNLPFAFNLEKEEHTFDEGQVTIEPTTTAEGEMTYTCTVCEYKRTEVIEKLDHEHAFAWQKDGENHWNECSVCGEVKDLANHEYTWETKTPATCTLAEVELGTCVCGDTKTREGDKALGHTEVVDKGVAPTCTAKGLSDGKHCSVCNEVLVKQEEIAALGHTEEVIPAVAPTCEGTGLTEGKKCSVCGEILKAQEEVAALGHTSGEAVEENRKESTCTKAGSYDLVVKCSVCGKELSRETKTLEIAAHSEEVIPAVAPTCEGTGLTEGKKCSVCGEVLVAQTEVASLGHTSGEAVEENRVESTCKVAGSYDLVVKCSVCGKELSRETKALELAAHTEEVIPAVAPTCEGTGLTEGKKCSVCGKVLVAQTEVASLGHTSGEPVEENRVESTCTKAGSYDLVVKCSVCEKELSRETKALELAAHTEEVIPAVAPTCEGTGLTEGKKCSVCGEILKAQEEIEALGHKWDEGKVTTAPTCETKGVKTFTCSVCKEEKTEEIAALGHKYAQKVAIEEYNTGKATYLYYYSCSCGAAGSEVFASGEVTLYLAPGPWNVDGAKFAIYYWNDATGNAWTPVTPLASGTSLCVFKIDAEAMASGLIAVRLNGSATTGNWDDKWNQTADLKLPLDGNDTLTITGWDASNYEWSKHTHTEVVDQAVAATCTTSGLTEGKHCSGCGLVTIAQEEIAALGHNNAKPVEENRVESTCTEAGSYDLVVKCSVCEKELSRETKTLPLANHSYVVQFDEEYHWNQCSVCNDEKDKVEHQFDDGSVNEDLKVYACTGCEYQKEVNLYTIKWNIDGDVTTTVLEAGELITCELQPAKAPKSETIAYEFAGWSLNADGDVVELGKASESVTYYAIFNEVTRLYTVEIKYAYSDKADVIESKVLKFEYQEKYGEEDTTSAMVEGYLPSVPYFVGIVTEDVVLNVTYHKSSVWDGSVATAFSSGDGTKENPYIIASAAELAYLKDSTTADNSYYAGVYFQLGCSIDLADVLWSGIGGNSGEKAFAGDFNGAGYTIYNLNSKTQGVFRRATGNISNLTVVGNVNSSTQYTALIVGLSYTTINNCHAYGTVTSTNNSVGLIVGCFSGDNTSGENLNNCSAYGSVTGTYRVGGIVGYNWKQTNVIGNVTNCYNYSTVTGTAFVNKEDTSFAGAGGIAGLCGSGSTFENCKNYGNIIATEECGSAGLGGIVGTMYASIVTSCYNYGIVSGTSVVGGIVGYEITDGQIKESNNYGSVIATGDYAGGIAGYADSSITNCDNHGTVTGVNRVGGIAGLSNASIINSFNYGVITATGYVGGIVGQNTLNVEGCSNYGTVSCSDKYSGGIVGCGANSTITDFANIVIKNCENYGDIYASDGSGGIAGFTYCSINECKNYGNVSGKERVGGIAGGAKYNASSENVALTISNCVNEGNISSTTKTTAGIVGRPEGSNTQTIEIISCVNEGVIICTGTGNVYVGGIFGYGVYCSANENSNYGQLVVESNVSYTGYIYGQSKNTVLDSNNNNYYTE